MLKQIMPAIRLTVVLALLIGLIFPALITLIAQFVFPKQANGSLIRNKEGSVIGSELIGQKFSKAEYFQPRPSAAGSGYAGEFSGGTNLGPTSSKLIDGTRQLAKTYTNENLLLANEKPPVDAVTYSGSGLDPHISEANALFQARRIAKARNLPLQTITTLVRQNIEDRQFGIFGEPRINVLKLNMALQDIRQ
jgi:potassium-transporting ATPase KdpC subunit